MNTLCLPQFDTAATAERCFHCGEALPERTEEVTIGEQTQRVCCRGCAAAAVWIRDAGLDDYYRLRAAQGNRVDLDAGDYRVWDRAEVQAIHVHATAQGHEITIAVEGLRCAACAWLIDRALIRLPGVFDVSVNAVTGRLRLGWQPERVLLSTVLTQLAGLGYRPHLVGGQAAEREQRQERNALLLRLGLAALAATQAMMFSEALYFDTAGQMPLSTRDFFRWLSFLLCTPVVFYSGAPILAGMVREWRNRLVGMDTLAAGSILLAYFASLLQTLRGGEHVWFDAAAMFVLFLLAARLLERFARMRANAQLDLLARAQPALAWRLREGVREQVPIHELACGDELWLPADQSVPADGVLLSPLAHFDESLLTGEATPVAKRQGEAVFAGSLCATQAVRMRVSCVGAQTRLSEILRLVERAQSQRPRIAELANRVAARFVLGMFALASLAVLAKWSSGPEHAFSTALAVLVAACPCALSLAVPAALSAAGAALARHGILLLSANTLERLAAIDTVLFDKTGTLTTAHPQLRQVQTFEAMTQDQALAIAAALEHESQHPLAAAFAGLSGASASEVQYQPGFGLEGRIGEKKYRLGRADFASAKNDDGAVWLGDGARALARFTIEAPARPDAVETLDRLRTLGLRVAVTSGDSEAAVRHICQTLGIENYWSRQSPEDKLTRLRQLQAKGQRVLMLGDGVNDAPVLAGADVSVAMDEGSAPSQRQADLILLDGALRRIPEAIALARATRRLIRQNLWWAAGYNLFAVGLAALGLLPPGLAALGMAGSSLLVTGNALRLSRRATFRS